MQSVYFTAPSNRNIGHLWEGVLPLCRDAVSIFSSPSQLRHRTLVGGSLTPLQRCSQCILQSQPTETQDTCGRESYRQCIFQLGQLGHRTLVGGSLTPLQRRSQCILQPQLTGLGELWILGTTTVNNFQAFNTIALRHGTFQKMRTLSYK